VTKQLNDESNVVVDNDNGSNDDIKYDTDEYKEYERYLYAHETNSNTQQSDKMNNSSIHDEEDDRDDDIKYNNTFYRGDYHDGHRHSQSDSQSDSDNDDDDADADELIQCIFCTKQFSTIDHMNEHTIQEHHGFSLSTYRRIHKLSYYTMIQFITVYYSGI
jgi:hypothetical protein